LQEGDMTPVRAVGGASDILGEGPVWDVQEQALYWVDIRGPALRRLDGASATVKSWPMPEMVGSMAVRAAGGVLVALRSALALFDPASGRFERVAAPEAQLDGHRFNDGKCDRQGRFWAGTMHDVTRDPVGTLYRLDARGCVAMEPGIRIPNSLCWSPDGRTMYFADSLLRTVFAYPFDPDSGELGARRVFATVEAPAIPDGATVDRDGFVWCAHYDGWRVVRFAPDGRIDRVLELPVQRPTSCQFGGPGLDTLYITTARQKLTPQELAGQPLAGALLALDLDVTGLPETRFAG
jgi:sugar lactone lactonase YvrE